MSRREFLKAAAGAGIGAAAGGAISEISNSIEKTPFVPTPPHEKIARYRTNFDTAKDLLEYSSKPTIGAEEYSRAEYVQHAFETLPVENMPEPVREKLALIAQGIPAQESRYNNGLTSNRGARGIWQLTQPAVTVVRQLSERNDLTLDDTKSLRIATEVAFAYLDKVLYPSIAEQVERAADHFRLMDQDERATFATLCLVNAYNAGGGRMSNVLEKITRLYSSASLVKSPTDNGITLFNAITERAYQRGVDSRYGKESSEYVFRVLAGAESLTETSAFTTETDSQPEGLAEEESWTDQLADAGRTMLGGVIGAAFGYASVRTKQIGTPKRWRSTPSVRGLTRRDILIGGGASAIAGAAAGQGMKAYSEHDRPKSNAPRATPEKEVTSSLEKYAPLEGLTFDGYTVDTEKIIETLTQMYENNESVLGEIGNNQFAKQEVEELERKLSTGNYYIKNYGRRKVRDLVENLHDKKPDEVRKYETKQDLKANTGVGKPLQKIEEISDKWRWRGMGRGDTGRKDHQNISDFMVGRPNVIKVRDEITQRLRKKLKNLSPNFDIRLHGTGLIRTPATSAVIDQSSPNSPHDTGLAIDISDTTFDLLHKPSKTMTQLDLIDLPPDTRRAGIARKVKALLIETLIDLDKEEKIILTWHKSKVHYHLTVIEE